jgi:hypothetical protein
MFLQNFFSWHYFGNLLCFSSYPHHSIVVLCFGYDTQWGKWPFLRQIKNGHFGRSGLQGHRRSCLTILDSSRRPLSKNVRHDLIRPRRPELEAEMSVFNLAQKRSFPPLCAKTLVLFICKTKSHLRRRHCGLARHFKTDPTETVALCFGYAKTLQLTMKALWPGASFQNRSY